VDLEYFEESKRNSSSIGLWERERDKSKWRDRGGTRVKIWSVEKLLDSCLWIVFRVVFDRKTGGDKNLYRKTSKTLSTHAIERKERRKENVWFDHHLFVIVVYISNAIFTFCMIYCIYSLWKLSYSKQTVILIIFSWIKL
jgi:hypothetical protein